MPTKRPAPKKKGKSTKKTNARTLPRIWQVLDRDLPFGPNFFLEKLTDFVRDKAPGPEEALPLVHLHLADGEVLDVSHVMGLGERWAALAVFEGSEAPTDKLRTELVPFEMITRISIRSPESAMPQIGFHQEEAPKKE